jgi:hypothetical protein
VSSGEGRAAAVEEGGIPVLVEMVEVGSSRQKEIATLSLLQICEDNSVYRTMVAREGAIPPLVALSQSSSARPKLKTKVRSHVAFPHQQELQSFHPFIHLSLLEYHSQTNPFLIHQAESLIEMLRQPRSPSLRARPTAVVAAE